MSEVPSPIRRLNSLGHWNVSPRRIRRRAPRWKEVSKPFERCSRSFALNRIFVRPSIEKNFSPFIRRSFSITNFISVRFLLLVSNEHRLLSAVRLGTGHQATNWKVVRDLKLTHIVNISIEHQCVFADKIKYLHLELEDKEDVLLRDRFHETIRFMEMALQNPSNRVLVHCNLGISRSTSLILAYLMKTFNATLLEAFKYLRHRRPIVCPNLGFLHQLIDFEYELFSYRYSDPHDPIFH